MRTALAGSAGTRCYRHPNCPALVPLARCRLHTDYKRPLHTFRDSFKAAIGLYFSKLSFG